MHQPSAGPRENISLAFRPRQFYQKYDGTTLWGGESSRSAPDQVEDSSYSAPDEVAWAEAQREAQEFNEAYESHVQFICSRVQHHWHVLTKEGERIPTSYCKPQRGNKQDCICKRGFPKHVIKDKTGQIVKSKYRERVVCHGVALEMKLRCTGRRNALGMVLGKRHCEWYSGTSSILAELFLSNTDIQLPYRVPLNAITHDEDCHSTKCLKHLSNKHLCIITQKAMKQMAGYFGGYISKRQKMGRFEVQNSIKSMPFLQTKLAERNLRKAGSQLAHVVNRMFTTLEGKGILRTAVEEFLLASEYRADDELAQEFTRTFRHTFFFGRRYVERYDALLARKDMSCQTILKGAQRANCETDASSSYGFRGNDARVYYLSPWEFVQAFRVVRVPAPCEDNRTTRWVKKANRVNPIAGTDYVFTSFAINNPDVVLFPELHDCNNMWEFRHTWMMLRRSRPVVPCPEDTPLPNRRNTKEHRAKLLNIYLRPWTLVREHATLEVPFILDLQLTKNEWLEANTETVQARKRCRTKTCETANNPRPTLRRSWKDYLSRVLPGAAAGVRNFLLATMAEGRNIDRDDTAADAAAKMPAITCHLTVTDVADLLHEETNHPTEEDDTTPEDTPERLRTVHPRVQEAVKAVSKLLRQTDKKSKDANCAATSSQSIHFTLPEPSQDEVNDLVHQEVRTAGIDLYTHDWRPAYLQWKTALLTGNKPPYEQQWLLLDAIHERCVREATEAALPERTSLEDPFFRLAHGLPGSGKSEVLKWLTRYFQQVIGRKMYVRYTPGCPNPERQGCKQAAGAPQTGMECLRDVRWMVVSVCNRCALLG